ncbi:hypothetical protein [Cohnella sp. GCM10027633]|uniref:hypothetical protein n=1 Tax=unclassified Cohnella TaxID=2636738 RepID=UPI003643E67A
MADHKPETMYPVLYQSDSNKASALKSIRDHVHQIICAHVNRMVRVQTLDGLTFEGMIVGTDGHHVQLRVANPSGQRFLGPGIGIGFGFGGPGFGFGGPGFGFGGPGFGGPGFGGPPFFGPSDAAILTLVLFELLVIVLLA